MRAGRGEKEKSVDGQKNRKKRNVKCLRKTEEEITKRERER